MVAPDNLILVDVPDVLGAVQHSHGSQPLAGEETEGSHPRPQLVAPFNPTSFTFWPQADKDPERG